MKTIQTEPRGEKMSEYSYKELDKEILELYVDFWKHRAKMSYGNDKINALSSIAVYSEVLGDTKELEKAIFDLEEQGYHPQQCINLKKRDLEEREELSKKSNVAFEYGDIYAIDLHEAGFKLDLLYRDGEQNYSFVPWGIECESNYIRFIDTDYDSEMGESQWLTIPFCDMVEFWKAKKS